MTRHRRLAVLAPALALALAAAPAAAWSPPVAVSDAVSNVESVALVPGADGRTLVTWHYYEASGTYGFAAAARRPDGRWGPRQTLGVTLTGPGPAPRRAGVDVSTLVPYKSGRWIGLAGSASGKRLQWWTGTTTGKPRLGGTLGRDPWELGRVAATPRGSAVAVWTTAPPRRGSGSNLRPRVVMLARRAAGAGFDGARRVSPPPSGPPYGGGRGPRLSATSARVAISGRTVAVVWQREGVIEARLSRDGGAGFRPARRLGASAEAFPGIEVAVSPQGAATVIWGDHARYPTGAVVLTTRVARSRADGSWSISTLERTPPGAIPWQVADQYGPRVRVLAAGTAPVVAWQGVEAGRVVVRAARLSEDVAQPLGHAPAPGAGELLDDLTGDASGRLALAWHTLGETVDEAFGSAFAAQAPPGGSLSTADPLPGGPGADVHLAWLPTGLLAAWTAAADGERVVRASTLP